jgi:hypothetical protein
MGWPHAGQLRDPIARILATWQHGPDRMPFVGAHCVDDEGESIHLDQHSETTPATEEWITFQPTRGEGSGTDRALIRGLAQQFQISQCCWRLLLTPAVVAQQKPLVAVNPHCRSAVVAVCHDVGFVDAASAPTFTFTHGDGWSTEVCAVPCADSRKT